MSIQPFDFQGHEVRVLVDDGEPRWVASDVAKVLGYAAAKDMTRMLDADEKGRQIVPTLGGEQEMTVITEAGLYACILKSRVPAAREFKRWVTHEVLPSIRKRGGYLTAEAAEQALTDPDFIIRLATELKEERAKVAELKTQAQSDAPKVLFANAVGASKSTILVGELAKILKGNGIDIGATRLFAWLRTNGFLINRKGSDWNSPTQKAMDMGLFKVKETAVTHSDGHVTVSKTPKVTGKGQEYFVARFLDGRFELAA